MHPAQIIFLRRRLPAALLLCLALQSACRPVQTGPTATEAIRSPRAVTASTTDSPTASPRAVTASTTDSPTASPRGTAEAKASEFAEEPAGIYLSQPGDTFRSVAGRLGVYPLDLDCVRVTPAYCPNSGDDFEAGIGLDRDFLLPPGTAIRYPSDLRFSGPADWLIPDSELVFSAAASHFDAGDYVASAGGDLAGYRQYLMMNAWNSGADIVSLVALENSINPRLLLALLEYQCGCVLEAPGFSGPFMGAGFYVRHDLYGQLVWAVHELSEGYYGWRAGTLTRLTLADGTEVRPNPHLNAGTVGLYNLFAKLYGADEFWRALGVDSGFSAAFTSMFGNPWNREQPIYTGALDQPDLDLPFEPGLIWSFTGGPHPAFEGNGPLAALDFAPASAQPGCEPTSAWVTAAADGLVVRSEYGLVMQDLDGDGDEGTGWVLMYLHVAEGERVETGVYVRAGERLGRPSCEGGRANGTHLHIARKLNGEWISAGAGPLPFNLGGWVARDGDEPYKGRLRLDGQVLEACTCSWRLGWITNE